MTYAPQSQLEVGVVPNYFPSQETCALLVRVFLTFGEEISTYRYTYRHTWIHVDTSGPVGTGLTQSLQENQRLWGVLKRWGTCKKRTSTRGTGIARTPSVARGRRRSASSWRARRVRSTGSLREVWPSHLGRRESVSGFFNVTGVSLRRGFNIRANLFNAQRSFIYFQQRNF